MSFDVRAAFHRVRDSLSAIVQIVAAAIAAYAFAHVLLGHENPFLSVTVCISSLSLARDARPRRVLDTALGITFGVVLANISLLLVGRGMWQLVLVLGLVVLMARFVHRSPGFAVSAGIQASLVQLIPIASGSEIQRPIDAVVGGAMALAATAIVPRDARRLAKSDERALVQQLGGGIRLIEAALHHGDADRAERALEHLRATDRMLSDWNTSLESAKAIATISPFVRQHLKDIERQREVRVALDYAVRNARVVARRVWQLLAEEESPRPQLARTFEEIAIGVGELEAAVDDPDALVQARQSLTLAIVRLHPASHDIEYDVQDATVLMQCRPLLVDLLTAAGLTVEEARERLPDVDQEPI